MKTAAQKRDGRNQEAKKDDGTLYVTLPSTMNGKSENEDSDEPYGYPDFYEDTDNMNRYLW